MKSRNYINKNVVWFGSCGKDKNGNKIEAHNYESDVLGLISNLNYSLEYDNFPTAFLYKKAYYILLFSVVCLVIYLFIFSFMSFQLI